MNDYITIEVQEYIRLKECETLLKAFKSIINREKALKEEEEQE